VQYSYDDRSVVIVNSWYKDFPAHTVTAKVYNLDLSEKYTKSASADIAPDSATRLFQLPDISGLSSTYFVKLTLADRSGATVSSNFYWLSTQPDVSNFPAGNGRYTPIKTYADLTALESLPRPSLKVASRPESAGAEHIEHVTVENPSKQLAFFIHLKLTSGGREIAPVIWEDNYFSLMPGERRTVTATVHSKDLGGAPIVVAE
jgi:exo-1,4-beta-D-glucosaminidase